ncbi:MAG: hypothetical protein LBR53_01510 [Deltaproteobacteria bacterium]|jgi:hypothetical protein|nr:hypothetical protein [Deltaproteobacteria bacterium]
MFLSSVHHIYGILDKIEPAADPAERPLRLTINGAPGDALKKIRPALFEISVYDLRKVEMFKESGLKVGDPVHAELRSLSLEPRVFHKGLKDAPVISGLLDGSGDSSLRLGTPKRRSLHHIACQYVGRAVTAGGRGIVFIRENNLFSHTDYSLAVPDQIDALLAVLKIKSGDELLFAASDLHPSGPSAKTKKRRILGRGLFFLPLAAKKRPYDKLREAVFKPGGGEKPAARRFLPRRESGHEYRLELRFNIPERLENARLGSFTLQAPAPFAPEPRGLPENIPPKEGAFQGDAAPNALPGPLETPAAEENSEEFSGRILEDAQIPPPAARDFEN